jgi:hypothetical protein
MREGLGRAPFFCIDLNVCHGYGKKLHLLGDGYVDLADLRVVESNLIKK